MEKSEKKELIMKVLRLRHKLRVLESIQIPDNHEDLAVWMASKWDLEDEIHAIEGVIQDVRTGEVTRIKEKLKKTQPSVVTLPLQPQLAVM